MVSSRFLQHKCKHYVFKSLDPSQNRFLRNIPKILTPTFKACVLFGPWYDTSVCSKPCGGGELTQERVCLNGNSCVGATTQTLACNQQACPVVASWSEWAAWGSCSEECDGGIMTRTRTCQNGAAGDVGCDNGAATQRKRVDFVKKDSSHRLILGISLIS